VLKVEGLGFCVRGLGFRVKSILFKVWGKGLWFRAKL